MSSYVPASIRRFVAVRAEDLCEYCLIHHDHTFFGCEIEHILSEKHGGTTVVENLAMACAYCNSYKGSDIASLSTSGNLCRLLHPRLDRWVDHFELTGDLIRPLTEIGEATVRLLRINDIERVDEREILRLEGKYPTPQARRRMS